MSTAGISFGGLASGLDTKAIISALVSIEARPIRALETKKASYSKQKGLFGDLRGLLDKLTASTKALKQTTDFLQMRASSDNETVLTASASSSATPGSYRVRVDRLAQAQVNSSDGRASATTAVAGSGSLEITVGTNTYLVSVGASATLESIAAAINAEDTSLGIGVRAEVINTGSSTDPYQLVVRSTKTGAANNFTIAVDDGSGDFVTLINQINANVRSVGQDAQLVLNGTAGSIPPTGIIVSRPTNQISDLFAGITLDLKSANPGADVVVTVSTDAEETSKKVQEFVDAYNKVVDFFTAQNALDGEGKATSPLFGDPTTRSMRSNLRTILGGSVDGTGNEAYQLLSQLGITSDKSGKLTFNQGKFGEALADDENAVAAVFTESTNGVANRLLDQIKVYTDSVDGLLKSRSDAFDRLVRDTQTRIDQSERRLTLYQEQLEKKYANLETLLSRLQSQGSSVGNIANLQFR